MAEIKKYLDLVGAEKLVDLVKAEDVKVADAAKAYADGLAKNYDTAGAAATAEANAKAYADGLAKNYDAVGSAAAVDAKLTTEVERAKAEEERIAGLVDEVTTTANINKDAIAAINNEETGILAQAKADATQKADAVQGEVDALEEYVGVIPTVEGEETPATVIAYIQKKTSGIATSDNLAELADRVTQAETDIDNIEKDYLKAADKTALQGNIDAEATARQSADDEIKASVKAISDDYLKAADKTELTEAIATAKQEAIATVLGEGVDADFDTLKEVADWILSDTTGAAALQTDVTTLKGEMDAVEGEVDTLQSEMDAVEAAVAKKVEQTAYDEKVAALEGADSAMAGRLDAIETQLGTGEGSVSDQIADAKAEAITEATETAAADATSKANKALDDAKAYADAEDAKIEARVDALEEIDHEHANKALLDTYTQTEANLADAVAKKHEHANKAVLDGIDAAKVAAWDAAEGNAKTYADGLNTAMTTKVDGIDDRLEIAEAAVATKAEADDLDAAIERIAKNETDIAANAAAIASFVRITDEEIAALFA